MIRDALHAGVLVLAFATLVTAHITLVLGLLRRPPWWRGVVGLLLPPLAPWWGWRGNMRVRSGLWVAAAVVYLSALASALH
jgi:hypothetical protein